MVRSADSVNAPRDVRYDVLAAPDPAAWRGEDPCRGWPGTRRSFPARRGTLHLLTRPTTDTDPGAVWAVAVRPEQVIAIRLVGHRVPRSGKVEGRVEWWFLKQILDGRRLGLVTDHQVLDQAETLAR